MLLHEIKHTLAFIMIDAWMMCTKQTYIGYEEGTVFGMIEQ